MSTITKEFTKEQLIARVNQVTAINKYRISRDPDADGLAMDNELLAIALASLEAPVLQCPFPCGWENLNKYAIQDAAFVARSLVEGEMVTEAHRHAVFANNERLLKVIAAMLQGAEPDSDSTCK